jgi:hypothetical protein
LSSPSDARTDDVHLLGYRGVPTQLPGYPSSR